MTMRIQSTDFSQLQRIIGETARQAHQERGLLKVTMHVPIGKSSMDKDGEGGTPVYDALLQSGQLTLVEYGTKELNGKNDLIQGITLDLAPE